MSGTRRRALIVLSHSAFAALAALTFTPATPIAAQSELVILKEGTTLYHRPGCPVIRDGAGVLALTKAQAEGRGYNRIATAIRPTRTQAPCRNEALRLSPR